MEPLGQSRFTIFNSSLGPLRGSIGLMVRDPQRPGLFCQSSFTPDSVSLDASVRGVMFASSDVTGTVAPQIREMWGLNLRTSRGPIVRIQKAHWLLAS